MLIASLPRVFKIGAVELEDPDPQVSIEDAWALLKPNFPHLRSAVVNEPSYEADRVVIEISIPPVKTNG